MAVPTTITTFFPTFRLLKKPAIITLSKTPHNSHLQFLLSLSKTHKFQLQKERNQLRTCISFEGMKLPSQNNLYSLHNNNNSNRYEPKSVLDVRRSPPSPIDYNYNYNINPVLLSSREEQLPVENFDHDQMINHFEEEWDSDSLIRELGLFDDSNKSVNYPPLDLPQLPPFFQSDFENLNPNSNQNPFDFMTHDEDNDYDYDYDNGNEVDFRDELIRLADCFETQSFQLAEMILARLNQRLRAPTGKAVQRAAFYFKEAIQCLLTGSARSIQSCTSYEIVQVIKAYKMFSNVSPIPMFSSFTANQAILDAMDGAMIVHVIDFDIGLGGQWASFLKAVAEKAEARRITSPAVRITAVVPEEYESESRLIRENLHQFSRDLKLRFDIDFISIRAFEILSFKAIKFINGEKTAVLLSPTIFRRIGSGFVNDLRQISPHVVVYVDGELIGCGTTSFFRQTVIDGLELYSTILASLEAANVGGGGGGGDWIRNIEMFVLLPKIIAAVEDAGRRATPWREVLGRAGMRPVGLSQFADFQAECLLRRVQVRGYHVAKQQAEMVLCWHGRPLVATSAWTF